MYTGNSSGLCTIYRILRRRSHGTLPIKYSVFSPGAVERKVGNSCLQPMYPKILLVAPRFYIFVIVFQLVLRPWKSATRIIPLISHAFPKADVCDPKTFWPNWNGHCSENTPLALEYFDFQGDFYGKWPGAYLARQRWSFFFQNLPKSPKSGAETGRSLEAALKSDYDGSSSNSTQKTTTAMDVTECLLKLLNYPHLWASIYKNADEEEKCTFTFELGMSCIVISKDENPHGFQVAYKEKERAWRIVCCISWRQV